MIKIHALSLAFLLTALTSMAQMSGSYTIGGTGANFTSVVQAVDTLNAKGVMGAVTFNIRSGTYSGRIQINSVTGVSAINTVTFQHDTANTTPVVIRHASTTAANSGTITFNGCSYVTFDSLIVQANGISFGHAVEFTGNCSNITFDKCSLEGYNTFISSNIQAVVFDNAGSTNNATNITIKNGTIKNGSYGIYARGTGTTSLQNTWTIENNDISGWYARGVDAQYVTNFNLNDNKIASKNPGTTVPYGVYFQNSNNLKVRRNQIEVYPVTYGYGLYLRSCNASFSNHNIVSSNTIYLSLCYYGATIFSSNYTDFVFNTVKADGGPSFKRVGYFYFGTANNIKNNILVNTHNSGYAYYSLGSQSHDYNNIWAPNTPTPNNITPGSNSISVDPMFAGTTDLHVSFVMLNAAGQTFPGVTKDIDNETRSTTEPDIGADEFDPDSLDVQLTSVDDIHCTGSQNVTAQLFNMGLDTIKTLTIHWLVKRNTGAFVAQTPLAWTGSLASANETTATLGTYNFQKDSTYQIRAYLSAPNSGVDLNHSNDTFVTKAFGTALSGTYTVGGSNADFATITNAVTALQQNGICGPTTIKLRSGAYNERVLLNNISGLSPNDTLLITADTGVTSTPTIFSTLQSTIELDGMSYVTFRNINIYSNSSNGIVLSLVRGNHHITVDSCLLRADTSGTSFQSRVISKNSGTPLHHLTVKNSTLRGGYFNITLQGTGPGAYDSSFVLQNTEVLEAYYQGVYLTYQNEPLIEDCRIVNRSLTAYTSYGVYMYFCQSLDFLSNYVEVDAPNPFVVYFNRCDGASSNPNRIINNYITMPDKVVFGGNGLYTYFGSYLNVMYNNVLMNGGGSQTNAIYSNGGTNRLFQNNCAVHLGGGLALNVTGTIQETNNNYYSRGGSHTNISQSPSSINFDPGYYNARDLHIQAIDLNGKGTPIAGITKDYDGQSRSITTPDIGADEFSPKANDLRPLQLVSPTNGDCGVDSVDLKVLVKNNGTVSQSTIPLEVRVLGPHPDTLSVTASKTIASNTADTINVGKISTRKGGRIYITIISKLANDSLQINDTLILGDFRINKTPDDPIVGNNIVACSDIDTTLVAQSNGISNYWYDAPGGNLIHIGDSYRVNIAVPDTVWVQAADDYSDQLGMTNTNASTGSNYSFMSQGLTFDAVRTFTLDSLTVHPFDSGDVIINLMDASNNLVMADTFKVNPYGLAVLPVNFTIPPGVGYKLEASGTNTRGMWRTYSGVTYPYRDGDSSVVITGDINGGRTSYYFFYDWHISVDGCESGLVEVPIGVRPSLTVDIGRDTGYCVGVSINHPLNATTATAVGYKWQNNSTNSNYTVVQKGIYFVDVTAPNGCVTRDSIEIIEVPIPQVTFSAQSYCENGGPDSLQGAPLGGRISGPGVVNNQFHPGLAGLGNHLITYVYSDYYGCTDSATAFIFVDTTTSVSLAPMSAICQDRTNRVQLTGGSPSGQGGYYFGKNVQLSKLLPKDPGIDTIYYVFYGLNGCEDTAMTTVQVNPSPLVTFDSIPSMCENGGGFPLVVSPGGGTFSGGVVNGTNFDPSATGAGTHLIGYTVNGTGGCNTTELRPVKVHPRPAIQLPTQPSVCENQNNVGLIGGNPPTGIFFGPFVNSTARTFDVSSSGVGQFPVYYRYTDFNGCTDTASENVEVKPIPVVNLGGDRVICGTQVVELDAGNSGATYDWSTGGTNQKITVTKTGRYSVLVNLNGCQSQDEVSVTFHEICLGISSALAERAEISLFPNPVSSRLTVQLKGMEGMRAQLRLTGMLGELIAEQQVEDMTAEQEAYFDMSALAEGVYLIQVSTEHGAAVYRVTVGR